MPDECPRALTLDALVFSTTFCVLGIVSIWAIHSRFHRLFRAAVVTGVPALAVLISASHVAMAFSAQVAGIALAIGLARVPWRRLLRKAMRRTGDAAAIDTSPVRFSLRSMFVATAFVACWMSIASSVPKAAWPCWREFAIVGGGMSVVTMAARSRTLSKLRWPMFVVAVALVAVSFAGKTPACFWSIAIYLIAWGLLAAWFALAGACGCCTTVLAPHGAGSGGEVMGAVRRGRRLLRKAAKPALVILSLVILGPPVGVYAFLLFGRRPECKPPAPAAGGKSCCAWRSRCRRLYSLTPCRSPRPSSARKRTVICSTRRGESSAKAVTSIQSPRVHPTHSRRLRLLEG